MYTMFPVTGRSRRGKNKANQPFTSYNRNRKTVILRENDR